MIEYRVWIEIERYDDGTDEYENLDSPFGSSGVFDTEEQAQEFAQRLHEVGQSILEEG